MLPIYRSISSCHHLPKSHERRSFDLSLYLVANRPSYPNENFFFSKIIESVKGGVTCVQLRDYKSDFDSILRTAASLKKMLKGTPLFINTLNSLEVIQAVGADGIFIEEKFSPSEVRKLFGRKLIIGKPVRTMDEVLAATQNHEIDYLSVKVSPSKQTCPNNHALWGMEGLRRVRALSPHRIVAIGGLNLECAESVYRELHLGDGLAMAGGLMEECNPYLTAKEIRKILQRIRGQS